METDALWRRVIEVKYGNDWGGWCTKKVTNAYGVSLWRYIRSGYGGMAWRPMLYGGGLLRLNMGMIGVVGARKR